MEGLGSGKFSRGPMDTFSNDDSALSNRGAANP